MVGHQFTSLDSTASLGTYNVLVQSILVELETSHTSPSGECSLVSVYQCSAYTKIKANCVCRAAIKTIEITVKLNHIRIIHLHRAKLSARKRMLKIKNVSLFMWDFSLVGIGSVQ